MNAYKTLIGLAVIAGGAGCTLSGTTAMETSTPATASTTYSEPELVAVDEQQDVWVVQDAPAPTYYSNGSYWSYRDNNWYQSTSYNGGWVAVSFNIVPWTIVNRDHRQYVHYRGAPTMRRRHAPHMGYGGGPRVREAPPARYPDHRGHHGSWGH